MKKKISLLFAVLSLLGLVACGGGGESSLQDNLAQELKTAGDGKWECYEVVEHEGNLSVKIEVDYVVSLQEGKKALDVVKKLAPQAKGMIDFTNAQTGMVVRKVPIE